MRARCRRRSACGLVAAAATVDAKRIALLVTYLKVAAASLVVVSALGIALIEVAPLLTLEQLIFMDWYGQTALPPEARKPFRLAMLLFDWLSILSGITLYYVIRHGIERRERWAYHCYLWLGLFWPAGAIGIALYTTAYWYLLSAGAMAVLFAPPVFLLRRHLS